MNVDGYHIRSMSRAELDLAVDWAASEGWNPGLADVGPFHAVDPSGFLVGCLNGRPAASISAVRYPGGFGFIGFYIVVPDLRGQGLGLRLWQAAMAHLKGCTIGLDGVIAQQDNYRRSGFQLAWRNIRFGGDFAGDEAAAQGLIDARILPMDDLAAYDRRFFPAERPGFLASWIAMPGAAALAQVTDGAVTGFGVVRPCRNGAKIGPLYADDPAIARKLFAALAARVQGGPVFLDVPEPNGDAIAMAEAAGLIPQFETARMYAGPAPALDAARQYGITTFELG